jgi:hypothetical protein
MTLLKPGKLQELADNKDENNKLEGLHQKPDQMEETR